MAQSSLLVLSLVFLLGALASAQDLERDRAALLALRSALGRSVISWNATATPCSWRGVICSAGRVSTLRLPGSGLIGTIPEGSLGNLNALRTLSLRLNAISGPLPSDLAGAVELRNIYLQGNRFSGAFPSPLSSLPRLVHLNLAGNSFSGEIPASLNNLTRLVTLFLESNKFNGRVPSLPALAHLSQFNVSFNNLTGPIPPSLRGMPASSFLGMKSLCGGPLGPCPGEISPSPSPAPGPSPSPSPTPGAPNGGHDIAGKSSSSSKLSGGAIAGIAVGSVIGFLILVGLVFFLCSRRGSKQRKAQPSEAAAEAAPKVSSEAAAVASAAPKDSGMERNGASDNVSAPATAGASSATRALGEGKRLMFVGGRVGNFDLEDLLRASAEVLGKGTYGTSYKAVLETGEVVAVKRLQGVTAIQGTELRERMEQMGAMEHPSLVPLHAYYFSNSEKLLVNEFMPMGSLSALLHGSRGTGQTMLNWDRRCAIALAVARGLNHIHSFTPSTSHGNIKSSNVLLDQRTDARLSDYVVASLVIPSPSRVSGYRAPEVVDSRKVSKKADVYSFGVLLLELLSSKAPMHALVNEDGTDLPRWVQSVTRDKWVLEVFDHDLPRDENVQEDMVHLLQLAMDCVSRHPDQRPWIEVVVSRIEDIHSNSLARSDQSQHLHQPHLTGEGDDQSLSHTHIVEGSNPGEADP